MKKILLPLSIFILLFASSLTDIISNKAFADSQSITFESPTYSTGNINGQDGWTKTGSYDVAVVSNTYGYSSFGSQSLRISDAVTSGSFGDQTFAKPVSDAVGEVDSTAGSFSTGTLQRHFEMQFAIASTTSSQQTGMHLSVSPDRGDGSRMSYLRFEDGTSGINVFFDDVQGTSNPANFVETQIATGLSRSVAHTVNLTLDAIDGPSNDVVKVWIDGTLVHTGTSWENYYRYDSEASAEQSPRIVKTVLFRESGTAHPGNSGNGYLIDNLTISSGPIPTSLNLHDATTNANDLTSHGASAWTTNFPFASSTEATSFVRSSGQNLTAPNSSSLNIHNSDITLESWIQLSSVPSTGVVYEILGKYQDDNNNKQYALEIGNTGSHVTLSMDISTTGGNDNRLFYNLDPVIGTWYHVAGSYNHVTGAITLYVNGSQVASSTIATGGPFNAGANADLGIGSTNAKNNTSGFFDGVIDEVRIWNTARTATQIANNYNHELTGSESGLMAYYPFETISIAPQIAAPVYGSGVDGDLTISSDTTESPIEAPATGILGSNTLSATNASFAAGQVILIHQSREDEAGTWQLNTIQNYSSGTITLGTPLNANYLTNAQVRVVPQYHNVTIDSGVTYSAEDWHGGPEETRVGGILAFLANGTVTVNGTIAANGISASPEYNNNNVGTGYRGGVGEGVAFQGEGIFGWGYTSSSRSSNGNGGGGGYGPSSSSGGGGGGNGTAGANGSGSYGGFGGTVAGTTDLTRMVFGGGGGGAAGSSQAGSGAGGGGIIMIFGKTITIGSSGSIVANGANGGAGTGTGVAGGGGGGAGGSVLLKAQTATLGTSHISAVGGTGGAGIGGGSAAGNGGDGRIRIEYGDTLSGTTTPTASTYQDSALVVG